MFSGIVSGQAKILSVSGGAFKIENMFGSENLAIGCSIAHDGACMTLTNITPESYTFFAMEESLSKTNFGTKKAGDTYNIEQCIRYGDRVDGHFVTGHIDTRGTITKTLIEKDGSLFLEISYPPQFNGYIISKGSIAINGVSLTVVDDKTDSCSVRIIPHTQKVTNLGTLCTGDIVNIEFDMIAKYAHKNATSKI